MFKEEQVAEEAKEEQVEAKPAAAAPQQKPVMFIALALFNMLVVIGVGAMIYLGGQKKAKEPGIDDVIKGQKAEQTAEADNKNFIGELIPLETFIVNLSGSRGRKIAKINMELEVSTEGVQEEIDQLKPKIRDIIIMILSSKSYAQVSTKDGKDTLRKEIRDQVNLFLTKGQIKRVYFTEFIYN